MNIKIIINNIKEHLEENEDAFKKGAVDSTVCEFGCDELRILLDYITNLQEENENNKKAINLFKDDLENMCYQFAKEKSRNKKAIEYIENDLKSFLYSIEYKTLLNILKSGDKE